MDIGITGIGAATPLGTDYRTIADTLLAGRSGIDKVILFSVADHPSQIAGSVPQNITVPSDNAPPASR